jgi:hypothetical protein
MTRGRHIASPVLLIGPSFATYAALAFIARSSFSERET